MTQSVFKRPAPIRAPAPMQSATYITYTNAGRAMTAPARYMGSQYDNPGRVAPTRAQLYRSRVHLGSLAATAANLPPALIAQVARTGFMAGVVPPSRGLSGLGLTATGQASLIGAGSSLVKTKNPVVGSAAKGASLGASVGSVVPVLGTAIGAAVGAILGAIGGAFIHQKIPEAKLFDEWRKIAGSKRGIELDNQFRNGAFTGFFRIGGKTTWPPKVAYGQKGDSKFLDDMAAQIAAAIKNGSIGANDDATSIFEKVVKPWTATMGGNWENGPADWVNWQKQAVIGQIDAYIYDQPIVSTGYTTSRKANPSIADVVASLPSAGQPPVSQPAPSTGAPLPVAPPPVTTAPAPAQPIPLPVGPAPTPAVPAPVVNPTTTGANVDVSGLVAALMAQGATQQQAFAAALQSLAARGVTATPAIQQQVADQVSSAGAGGALPAWAVPAGLALLGLSFVMARPSKPNAVRRT